MCEPAEADSMPLMKLTLILFGFAVIPAFSAAITCNAGADSIPVFNPSSTSGAVGDYTLDCTGGTPVSPPSPVPEIDIDAFMNVPVLNTGGWILTDGVNMTPGTLVLSNLVEFLGVPFNPPGAGTVVFTVENISVDPSFVPPGFQFQEEDTITADFSIDVNNAIQLVGVNAPEPGSTLLLGLGLGALIMCRTLLARRYGAS